MKLLVGVVEVAGAIFPKVGLGTVLPVVFFLTGAGAGAGFLPGPGVGGIRYLRPLELAQGPLLSSGVACQ